MHSCRFLPLLILLSASTFATAQLPSATPTPAPTPSITDVLTGGRWKFKASWWSAIRSFNSDGTFVTHGMEQPGTWAIAGDKLVLTFADGHTDTLDLPIDPKGTKGTSHRGDAIFAARLDVIGGGQLDTPGATIAASKPYPIVTRKPKVLIAIAPSHQENFANDYDPVLKEFEAQLKSAGYAVTVNKDEPVTEQDLQDYDVFYAQSLQPSVESSRPTIEIYPIKIWGEILADRNKILIVRTLTLAPEIRKSTTHPDAHFQNYRAELSGPDAKPVNKKEYNQVTTDQGTVSGCTILTWQHIRTVVLKNGETPPTTQPYFSSAAGFSNFAKAKLMPEVLKDVKALEDSRNATSASSLK